MSRLGSADTLEVKPSNNVYTVLAGVAFLASLLALIVVFVQQKAIFNAGLF
jgi:hypothetical protein